MGRVARRRNKNKALEIAKRAVFLSSSLRSFLSCSLALVLGPSSITTNRHASFCEARRVRSSAAALSPADVRARAARATRVAGRRPPRPIVSLLPSSHSLRLDHARLPEMATTEAVRGLKDWLVTANKLGDVEVSPPRPPLSSSRSDEHTPLFLLEVPCAQPNGLWSLLCRDLGPAQRRARPRATSIWATGRRGACGTRGTKLTRPPAPHSQTCIDVLIRLEAEVESTSAFLKVRQRQVGSLPFSAFSSLTGAQDREDGS